MISLDTNVVLRFLLDDVPEQSKKAATAIENNQVYVTDVVATEVIFVLEKIFKLARKDIIELFNDFLGLNNLVYNQFFLTQTIDLYAKRPTLSIIDCYAAMEARVYNNTLATFDKALAKHGGTHVKEL